MLNLARDNIVCLPVHDSFIVRLSHQIDLNEEMDKAFKEIAGVDARREMKKTVLKDNDYKKQQAKLYQGEETVEGTEGVIIKGSNINYEQMDKLSKKYGGYHLREGQWIEHKGFI